MRVIQNGIEVDVPIEVEVLEGPDAVARFVAERAGEIATIPDDVKKKGPAAVEEFCAPIGVAAAARHLARLAAAAADAAPAPFEPLANLEE